MHKSILKEIKIFYPEIYFFDVFWDGCREPENRSGPAKLSFAGDICICRESALVQPGLPHPGQLTEGLTLERYERNIHICYLWGLLLLSFYLHNKTTFASHAASSPSHNPLCHHNLFCQDPSPHSSCNLELVYKLLHPTGVGDRSVMHPMYMLINFDVFSPLHLPFLSWVFSEPSEGAE